MMDVTKGAASESEDAAQDVLDAIASKDAKALDLALTRHYETCAGSGKDKDDDSEDAPASKRY